MVELVTRMVLEEDLRNLARNPTLSVFEPSALRRLALAATPRTLRAGEVLFRRDEVSDGGFFLRSGSIALQNAHDAEPRIIMPPALIGDMALITRTRRPATALVREPSSGLLIPRTLFQRALSEQPKSAERLRRIVAMRLRGFVKDLDDLRARMLSAQES